jgi:hypothetical protein
LKTIFGLMVAFSVMMAIYSLWTAVVGAAHNHYEDRYVRLHDKARDHKPYTSWGLTKDQLSAYPPEIAREYVAAVEDSYKLGTAETILLLQSLVLAATLFVFGLTGLFGKRSITRVADEESNLRAERTPPSGTARL